MTPEAGPDITVADGVLGDDAGRHRAAVALHHQQLAREAALAQLALQALDVAVQHRLDRGVHRRRRAALVLAVLGDARVCPAVT